MSAIRSSKAETIELLFVLIVSVQDDRFIKLKTIHLGLFDLYKAKKMI